MQEAFSEAFLHVSHRVLGVRLRPFSACHFLHLESVGCPLLKPDGRADAASFLHALKVCAIEPELIDGVYQIPFEKIKFTFADRFRLSKLATAKGQEKAIAEWKAYQDDFSALPERMENVEHKPAPLSAPGVVAAVTMALEYLPEQRAWTMPIGTLYTYAEVKAELNGAKIRFRPSKEDEEQILEELKEAEKRGQELLKERLDQNVDA
jgi:hypothetical protein